MDDQEFSINFLSIFFNSSIELGIPLSLKYFINGIIDPRGHVVIQSSSLISLSLNFNHQHNFIVCDSANYMFNTSRAYFFL